MLSRHRFTVLVLAFCFVAAAAGAQTATGTINGRVLDGVTGEPLPGATILVERSSIVGSTDRTGTFRVSGAPAGEQTLLVTYLGKQDGRVTVAVKAGDVVSAADIKLERLVYSETVTVIAEIIQGVADSIAGAHREYAEPCARRRRVRGD